nr:AGE family epimerase/isomerase [uncultured Allomuricauda sp.]
MTEAYKKLQTEMGNELERILQYWETNTVDLKYGGFLGGIDHTGKVLPDAPKGIILNTRILWSFSAASNHLKTDRYRQLCDRAYDYLCTYFKDSINQGVFWELDHAGNSINSRKQIYAQAFAIYALSEYYVYSKKNEARLWAISLFETIETTAKDRLKGGYFEAYNRDWSPIEDMRLSEKDMNASKTMNTHLHILEAYTRLADIYENNDLTTSLHELVQLFQTKFLNKENHYDLFFDTDWNLLSSAISYGHDIETSWLVIEAAKRLENKTILKKVEQTAIKVADTFIEEAIALDGGVINEKDSESGHLDTDRHWWPQVEALIGLNYAYRLTENRKHTKCSLSIWEFIKTNILDYQNGEWYFRVDENGKPYEQEDKVSMWKAPYHTTRACILLNSSAVK